MRILQYLGSLNREEFEALFRGVREIETRMNISGWKFSTSAQTIENASLLARSPYYQEWRSEVAKVFDEIDRVSSPRDDQSVRRRLVLMIFPARLPLDPQTIWARWRGMGKEVALDSPVDRTGRRMLDALFGPSNFLENFCRQRESHRGRVGD